MRVILSGGPNEGQTHEIFDHVRIFHVGDEHLPHAPYHATGETDPKTRLPIFAYQPPDLVKEGAPGKEHEGIRGSLRRWAIEKGFTVEILSPLPNGGQPDIMRSDRDGHMIFLGDSKDSEHETTKTLATFERVSGYWDELVALIASGTARKGVFAIATNNKHEAGLWKDRLAGFATKSGVAVKTGDEEIAQKTWVAFSMYG